MGTRPAKYPGWDRPVEQVSYDDIRGREKTDGAGWPAKGHAVDGDSFLGRLRMKTGGLVLDLPTEAQWEYACRAGTSTALNSGKNLTDGSQCPNLDEVARNAKNQQDGKGGYQGAHARTGCYRPNNWGLYDMHGNVFEWCLDWQAYDLGAEPVTDPVGPASGMADPGQDSGARPEASRPGRVIRGGLFWGHPGICRSACRGMYGAKPFARSSFAGFRLVCVE